MKYAPRKVYIKENNVYVELSYTDFCRRRQADQSYMDKLFIPVQGCLLEVMREQYADFYKDKERWRYLEKLDINHSLLSLEGFTDSGGNMSDFIVDEAVDVAETVINVVLVYKCGQEKLNNLYYQMKEQRRCSTWRKIKNLTLRSLNSRSWICIMLEGPRIHNWNVNMA